MFKRNISVDQVKQVIGSGEAIAEYSEFTNYTQEDADSGDNPIPTPYVNTNTTEQV